MIDSSMYATDWAEIDESLYRLAERLRIMHECQRSEPNATPSWAEPMQKREAKRLKVFIEARFLFVPLASEKVDLGSFLSKFRDVGDVAFVPQKIRTFNEDESEGLLTSPRF